MRGLRLLLVGLAAAVLGCLGAAMLLVGRVDQTSFIPVPVMWLGTVLIVAPTDALLRARRVPMPLRSVPVVIVAAIGFAVVGALLSGGAAGTAVMGGVYGLVTAACWAALSAVPVRREPA